MISKKIIVLFLQAGRINSKTKSANKEVNLMVDEFSKVHSTCNIDTDANILESELKKDVVVKNFTRVLKSKLGEKVQLDRNNSILYSELGKYCNTGHNTTIRNAKLGNFNSISWNVNIGGNSNDTNKERKSSFFLCPKLKMVLGGNWKSASKECELGNDIWIGASVNILMGVNIGSGAIIGAGTVVTKDVPPYAVVAGNPGKVISMRYSDEIIEKMLEVEWWNFPSDIIRSNSKIFESELTMDVVDELFKIKEEIS